MACISSKGELTESTRKMLTALEAPSPAEEVASRASLPLFRVRAGLREMLAAELVELKDDLYGLTASGRSALLR